MSIRNPDESSRTGRTGGTGVFALTGRQGTEHAHGAGDEPEASVFSGRSGEPARKFDGCPNRPNLHVILIAGHAAGPATWNGGTTCNTCSWTMCRLRVFSSSHRTSRITGWEPIERI